jgi:hypothetical protein
MNAMIVNDMSRFIIVELPAPATHAERERLAERIAAVLAHEPKPEAAPPPPSIPATITSEPACGGAAVNIVRAVLGDAP